MISFVGRYGGTEIKVGLTIQLDLLSSPLPTGTFGDLVLSSADSGHSLCPVSSSFRTQRLVRVSDHVVPMDSQGKNDELHTLVGAM